MPLDPTLAVILKQSADAGVPGLHELSPEEGRAMYRAMNKGANKVAIAEVENLSAAGVKVRLYRPEAKSADLKQPCLIYFHGGGWVIGDLDTHDAPCRLIAQQTNCVVIAVDYRLAPEHPFPTPLDDCFAATQWVFENAEQLAIDPSKIAVGGDSAGGNLAAAVCLKSKLADRLKICHQLLIYPVTDAAMNSQSYIDNATGYMLTKDSMAYFWDHYTNMDQRNDPLASPLRASDLSNLPTATILTAEFDPLRDEAEAYAAKLTAAGTTTLMKRYDGLVHGFLGMIDVLDSARESIDLMASQLNKAFSGQI
ncbi:MAG: alpha/beta hydrolase [Pseudomonadales bacterium]|nr:alpha/beta hydrolase [Pseudomonadales bacterium]